MRFHLDFRGMNDLLAYSVNPRRREGWGPCGGAAGWMILGGGRSFMFSCFGRRDGGDGVSDVD